MINPEMSADRKIAHLFSQHQELTLEDMRRKTGCREPAIQEAVEKLCRMGLLKPVHMRGDVPAIYAVNTK